MANVMTSLSGFEVKNNRGDLENWDFLWLSEETSWNKLYQFASLSLSLSLFLRLLFSTNM